jgi:MFS transporter, SHS family, lactate transporter
LATGFAHSFVQFLVVRALFGIVMGGQWGVGVSLAMEEVPVSYRGALSGILQQGYSIGFLLASGAYFVFMPVYGWRVLFYVGSFPALAAALLVGLRVRESQAWATAHRSSFKELGRALVSNWKLFFYFSVFLMTMHLCSHGTQDLYPTFLEKDWGIVGRQKAVLTATSMVGAILGGLLIGWLSDRIGRRRAILFALAGAFLIIPLWVFAHSLTLLIVGAVLIQFCVQGAWGVVPAHVAELSPDDVRGTVPGLGNQVGVLLSSCVVYLEAALAKGRTYGAAMAITAVVVFCLAAIMATVGKERRAIQFGEAKQEV